jgi:hypothetical protein
MKKLLIILGILLTLSPLTATAAWTYEQTFNSLNDGDLNSQDSWSGSTGFDVTTDSAARVEGAKGLKYINPSGSNDISRVISDTTTGTVYVSIKKTSVAATSGGLYVILMEGVNTKMAIRFSEGIIAIYDSSVPAYVDFATSLSADTWYRIGIDFDKSGANPNQYRLNVNGGSWSTWKTVIGTTYNKIDKIKFDSSDATAAVIHYHDYLSPTASVPVVSSCTYSGTGDWQVKQSDNCYITDNKYIVGACKFLNDAAGIFGIASGASISCGDIQAQSGFKIQSKSGAKIYGR